MPAPAKMLGKLFPCAGFLAAWLSLATALPAQTAITFPPEGFVTLSIPAPVSATTPSCTAICLPLYDLSAASQGIKGALTGITSNTLSNANAGWTPGAFSTAAAPCFIRLTSGGATGRAFHILASPAGTATTITVNNQGTDLTTLGIATGDTYEIIAGDTLLGFFGTPVSTGIFSSTSADTSDNVQVWNGSAWQVFYYHSTNNRWQQKGINVSANNFVLRPDTGMMFVRRGSGPLSLRVFGKVPECDLRTVFANAGGTFLANGFPAPVTLSSWSLQTQPGWVRGTDPSVCDTVQYWNGGAWQIFYYHSTNNRWQQKGINVSANSFSIAAGKPVMIVKSGAESGSQVLVQTRPYPLN